MQARSRSGANGAIDHCSSIHFGTSSKPRHEIGSKRREPCLRSGTLKQKSFHGSPKFRPLCQAPAPDLQRMLVPGKHIRVVGRPQRLLYGQRMELGRGR